MFADFVMVHPVGNDSVVAKHGAEIPKRGGTAIVSPLPVALRGDHSTKFREGDLVYPEKGDG